MASSVIVEGYHGVAESITGDAGYADNVALGWMRRESKWVTTFSNGAEKDKKPPRILLNEEEVMDESTIWEAPLGEQWIEIDLGVRIRALLLFFNITFNLNRKCMYHCL